MEFEVFCIVKCFVEQIFYVCVQLSHSWGQPLGALVLPVRELLDEKDLVLDHWFTLDGAMPESEILLRAELKVRHSSHTKI